MHVNTTGDCLPFCLPAFEVEDRWKTLEGPMAITFKHGSWYEITRDPLTKKQRWVRLTDEDAQVKVREKQGSCSLLSINLTIKCTHCGEQISIYIEIGGQYAHHIQAR